MKIDRQFCEILAELVTKQKSEDQSLLHGNAGSCLFLLKYIQENPKKNYKVFADKLIEDIYENQFTSSSGNFEIGLAGIGCFIEYLIQNKIYDGISDEILGDADAKIFKAVVETDKMSLDLQKGIIGYFVYILMRLKGGEKSSTIYQINAELFKEIVNRLYNYTPEIFSSLSRDLRFDLLLPLPILLLSFQEALSLNLYNEKIIRIIKEWIPFLTTQMPSKHSNRLWLAIALNEINTYLLDRTINLQIRNLLFTIDREKFKGEIDLRFNNIQFGWYGIAFILTKALQYFDNTYPNYEQLQLMKNEILKNHNYNHNLSISSAEEMSKSKIIGLCDGWTGIGLLRLVCPQTFENVSID